MITIAYITSRSNPHFDWFTDSLFRQVPAELWPTIQVVFIDGRVWSDDAKNYVGADIAWANPEFHSASRRQEVSDAVRGRFPYLHLPPMPSAWQGPFRQTNREFFCASLARNSAIVACQSKFLCCVDDLSILGPLFFDQLRHAAQNDYVVCGCYSKRLEMKVVNGELVSSRANLNAEGKDIGLDSRWDRGSDSGIVPWHGGGLYGCSFGLPLEAALEVDGNDGVCDGGAYEDCEFGIRLERAGWPIFFNRNLRSTESEEDHHTGESPVKFRKLVTRENLPANYDAYKIPNVEEKYWSDHVFINRICNETDRITPILGSNLRTLRERYQATGLVPIPREPVHDWRDGVLLSDL